MECESPRGPGHESGGAGLRQVVLGGLFLLAQRAVKGCKATSDSQHSVVSWSVCGEGECRRDSIHRAT